MKSLLLLCVFAAFTVSGCATTSTADMNTRRGNVYLNAGTQALLEGRDIDALPALLQAVKLLPKNPSAWSNLGIAYLNRGEQKSAEDSWKKAIAIDPTYTEARNNLGALYLQQKRYKDAELELKKASEDIAYIKIHQVYFNLALAYSAQRKNLNAEQQLKLTVQADPGFCSAWYKLGQLQKERGEFTEATNSLKKSVSGPCFRNPEAHYEIGALYLKNREYGLAKSKLLEIIQLFPQSDWAKKAELTLNMMR